MADENIYDDFTQELYKKGITLYKGDGNPLSDTSTIAPSSIGDGFSHGATEVVQNNLQSGKFKTGLSGWSIDADGNAEFNNGTFRGTFILGGTLETISDITLLQAAINTVSAAGGGTVSLVPNTYMATSSFTIPSNVTVDGNGATIDFQNGAYQFLIQGTNSYSTGTLTATKGSAAIVGVGTTWTTAMVGQSILIGEYWYTIATRTDNTHITIDRNFVGTNLAGDTYVIATIITGVNLKNITLQNSSTALVKARYADTVVCDGVVTINGAIGFDYLDSANMFILGFTVNSCATNGIFVNNSPFMIISDGLVLSSGPTSITRTSNTAISEISIQDITGVGMKFTNCHDIGVVNYAIIETTSHGFEFVSGNNDIQVGFGQVDTAGGDGIKLTATSDRCTITATSLLNCTGYGINIAAPTCNDNQIVLPAFNNNTSGNVNDSGTNTFEINVKSGNMGFGKANSPDFLYQFGNQAGNVAGAPAKVKLVFIPPSNDNNAWTSKFLITTQTNVAIGGLISQYFNDTAGQETHRIALGTAGYSGVEQTLVVKNGIVAHYKAGNVASATTITATGNVFHVTGTTTITSVSGNDSGGEAITAGTEITIIFDGALTFTDGSNLKLAGNFVTTADDTITLVYDGSNWYEKCRSIN